MGSLLRWTEGSRDSCTMILRSLSQNWMAEVQLSSAWCNWCMNVPYVPWFLERFAAQVSTKLAGVSCIAAWWKSLILTFTQWPPLSVGSVDPKYLPGDEASASTSLDSPRGTWWNQLSQKPWWRAHGTAYSGTGHQVFRVSWNALFNFYRFCFGDVCFSIQEKTGQLTMKVNSLSKSNLGDEAIWTEWHAGKNATHSAYLQRLCVDSMITKCTGHLRWWRKCIWLGLRVRPVQWFKRIWSPNLRIFSTLQHLLVMVTPPRLRLLSIHIMRTGTIHLLGVRQEGHEFSFWVFLLPFHPASSLCHFLH